MSKKNYTKYSENTEEKEIVNKEVQNKEQEQEQNEEQEVQNEEQEQNEEENSGAIAPAVVANCKKLNVRDAADKDAEVVCVITEGTDLTVDMDKSTEEFYKVYTQAEEILVEGYCMKNFINIK